MNQWAFGWVVLNESGGNNSAHLPVAVKPTQNIPDINVTPTSLAATQAANTTTNQTLNIGNVGTGQLTWNIAEAPMPARLELTSARPEAPAAMADTNQPVSGSMGNDAMNLVSELGMPLPSGLTPRTVVGAVVDCNAEPEIIIHDDGTIENGYSGNPAAGVTEVRFVDRFTPTSYPATFHAVCISFISLGPTSLNFDIVVYDDDGAGGAPGTLLGSLPATAVAPVVPPILAPMWNSYDISSLGIGVTSGNVYVGVRYAPSTPNVFISADQTASTPLAGGYWWNNNAAAWAPIQNSYASYRALLVRAVQAVQPAACDNPADVPWLSVAPTSGNTAAGGSTPVTVGFNSAGLAPGAYQRHPVRQQQ